MLVWIKSCAVFAIVLLAIQFAYGRDPDGRYANSPLHDWFEQRASKKGPLLFGRRWHDDFGCRLGIA
jgi:hypothetical protein